MGIKMRRETVENLVCLVNAYKPVNQHSWGPGVRDIYALHYILSGRGYLECNGKTFRLEEGDSFLIYPQTVLYYYPDSKKPWEYVWVDFKGIEAEKLLEYTAFTKEQPVWQRSAVSEKVHGLPEEQRKVLPEEELRNLFQIPETNGSEKYNKERAHAKLRLLLSYYMEHYPYAPGENGGDFAALVREYVDNRYWNPELCVAEIADYLSIDRTGLFRKFKQAYGSSVQSYLVSCRMKRACQLLLTTELSVKAVACSVGYSDQMYFARVFRQQMGCTPSQYRQTEP